MAEFVSFQKIPRLRRPWIVTEKIDGTNGQIYMVDNSTFPPAGPQLLAEYGDLFVYAGSRNRWLQPGKEDNHGFASWVLDNLGELSKLGPGRHFGEWWGSGIQRGYGLPKGEKRFSLFNAKKWSDPDVRPECCEVVPVLNIEEPAELDPIWLSAEALEFLSTFGSLAAPGFMRPEGVVLYQSSSGILFKRTLENDAEPKGKNHAG